MIGGGPLAASTRAICAPRSAARYFSVCHDLSQQQHQGGPTSSSAQKHASVKGKEKESSEEWKSLYTHSRAASRPRANATSELFAARSPVKAVKSSQGWRDLPSSSSSSSLKLDETSKEVSAKNESDVDSELFFQDEVLVDTMRHLSNGGGKAKLNLLDTLKACTRLKARLHTLSMQAGRRIAPPLQVFHVLLDRFADVGRYRNCCKIMQDMREVGHDINMEELNKLLAAAVASGDEANVEDCLVNIYDLNRDLTAEEEEEQAGSVKEAENQHTSLLSTEWTRNWTPLTYQILLRRSRLSFNLEYSLALIASASNRQHARGDESSFLTSVLDVSTSIQLIHTVTHAMEARLAVELAVWFDNGIAARKLGPRTWMAILRCCAEVLYFPGIKTAWSASVDLGLISPDEGIVNFSLIAASRAGDTAFVEKVLDFYSSRMQTSHGPVREWHLLPLMQSQCQNADFESAMRTATAISRSSNDPISANRLRAMRTAALQSHEQLDKACDALLQVGRDSTHDGGVCISILNVLISAASFQNRFNEAFRLYRWRHSLRNEQSSPETKLAYPRAPPLGQDEEDLLRAEDRVKGRDTDLAANHPSVQAGQTLQADIHTYNEMLYIAVLKGSTDLGDLFLRQMNDAKVIADARTYEMAIRLELTKSDYENAFKLLEECKSRRISPNIWTYICIGHKCLDENDHRWVEIGREMLENDYTLNKDLRDAMIRGGYYTPPSRGPS